jgi:hypothetical protein
LVGVIIIIVAVVEVVALVSFLWGADRGSSIDVTSRHI